MMKLRLPLFLTLAVALLATNSCNKDEEDPIQDLGTSITAFTNQTGEPNETANGLQAQVVDNNNGNTVDFYGNFNALGEPDLLSSIRVTRPNSDTVVNFIINATTKEFERAIFEVNGQKLDLIVKFDFPQGDTTMILSHYEYNWSTGESELYYAGEYYLSNGIVGEKPVLVKELQLVSSDWIAAGVGLGTGVAIAEIAVATGVIAGASLVGTAVGAVVGAVAAVSSTVIIATAVVGSAIVAINSANASEIVPQNIPTPSATPPGNSSNQQLPDPLPENPCILNGVNVSAGVDGEDEITAIATLGTGQYTYSWSNGVTVTTSSSFHTIQPSEPGTYTVVVTDENNCAAAASATLGEPELSTLEKLIQWGPWRSQDMPITVTVNNVEDTVMGFATLSFSMNGLTVANYKYIDIVNDQYELVTSYGFCLEQGASDMTFLFDESPCQTPPEAPLTVSSITEQGAVINGDGEVLTCVPF